MMLQQTGLTPLRAPLLVRDGCIFQTFNRMVSIQNRTPLTSGQLYLLAVTMYQGDTLTTITFYTGSSGATAPTNWWYALYDKNRNLLAQTADQTTAVINALTALSLNLTTPYSVPATDRYYVGIMVAAAATPSLCGRQHAITAGHVADHPIILNGNSTGGLTTTPPNPAGAITSDASSTVLVVGT